MKRKSFVNEILIYLLILTAILVGILGSFLVSSYYVLEKEIGDASEAFVEIYSNEYNNTVVELEAVLTNIAIQVHDLDWIGNDDADKRLLSAVSLSNFMQDLLYTNSTADIIVVYDATYEVNIDAIKRGFTYNRKTQIKEITAQAVRKGRAANNHWQFISIDQDMYIYKMLISGSRGIAIFSNVNNLLDYLSTKELADRTLVLADSEGKIGKIIGSNPSNIDVGANITVFSEDDYGIEKRTVVDDQLYAYCFTGKNSIFLQTPTSMIIVAITVLFSVVFIGFILYFAKKQIASPMHIIIHEMEKIKDGQLDNRIEGEFRTKEFHMLQETTNQMVDEIIELKIQSYERRLAFQESELKSIRLQLRPHFFLNALSTISSLSERNKNKQIKAYIDALSKNVRYMFSAGFHTVTIKNELRHVENYIEIQEMKYPGSLFHMVDLPDELANWQVPQMVVHTFVENLYKYVIAIDKTSTLLIKVSQVEYQDEKMLLIEIEDDGNGYPEDVLEYMKAGSKKTEDNGTRTGLLSVRRMMTLMYEKENLITIENVQPRGCLSKIYVPREVRHIVK